MPMSGYLKQLREKVGHDLLILPSAAVVVLDDQMRVLLCLHADKNVWVTPGGLIEPGEQPADAAIREAWEETGLVVEITGILGVYGGDDLIIHYANGDVAAYIATIFRGKVSGGAMCPDGTETLDLRYFSREELAQVPHSRWMDRAMDVIFRPNAIPHFVRPSRPC